MCNPKFPSHLASLANIWFEPYCRIFIMKKTLFFALAAAISLSIGGASTASAQDRYVSALIGTKHFGTDALNNITPGVTFGKRWEGKRAGSEWFAEAGVFYNSYEEVSPIALFGTSTKIGRVGETEVRAGVAIGTAYYKELSGRLEDRYGIPNLGGFIPMAVASIAFRNGLNELRLSVVPPDDDAKLILNISASRSF